MNKIFGAAVIMMITMTALHAAAPRELEFGGQLWRIKVSDERTAPGPNYFSGSEDVIWVDEEGMHLELKERGGNWYAVEVFAKRPLGYGTYTFVVDTDITSYDPNVVAGFFTWDTSPEEFNREIDIEFAAWGMPGGTNIQYVVQPYTTPERIHSFDPRMTGTYSTHRIEWSPEKLVFASYHGDVDPDDPFYEKNLMSRWEFSGTPPSEGRARFRINLWLFGGRHPDAPASMTVKAFEHIPFE
jgi:hypothetical protein